MRPELPPVGQDAAAPNESESPNDVFAEDEERTANDLVASYKGKQRKESKDHSNLSDELARIKDEISGDEKARERSFSKQEQLERYESALQQSLQEVDVETAASLPHSDKDADRLEQIPERLGTGDTRLSVLRAVAETESEENPELQAKKRATVLAMIGRELRVSDTEAEAIYGYYAANPDRYRRVVELEKALAVLELQPDRFDDFVALLGQGDDTGIDQLFAEISATNTDFAERIESLKEHQKLAVRRLHQAQNPELKIEALLGQEEFIEQLEPDQQLALADALETVDQPVRESWSRLPFSVSEDGLNALWLGSDLQIRFRPHTGRQVFMDAVPVIGGIGQDFYEAAVIGQVREKSGNTLPIPSWRNLVEIVGGLGPKHKSPVADQITAGVRAVGMLRLDDPSMLERYRISPAGNHDVVPEAAWQFGKQVSSIIDDVGLDENLLNSKVLTAIADYWDELRGANRRPFVLSMNQIKQLLDTGSVS